MLWLRNKYPEAITSDFREYYNLSIWEVGKTFTFHEAVLLIKALSIRMGSALQAEINNWEYRMGSEDAVLRDLFDLLVSINTDPKKTAPKPYRRPFQTQSDDTVIKGTPISWEEAEKVYQFSSTKTEEEILEANAKYLQEKGSLKENTYTPPQK